MDYNSAINFKSNSAVPTTNLLDKYMNSPDKIKYEQKIPQQDKVVICKDFIADLKYAKDLAAYGTIVSGYVNGKKSDLKTVSNNSNESWYEGAIGDKYFLMHCNEKQYDGKYGDSDFNITVDYNKPNLYEKIVKQKIMGRVFRPDYFIVKGYFGNKKIDITMPNIKIPDDNETRDIITMILEDNGLKAQTINGEVKSLKFSLSALKSLKEKHDKRKETIDKDIRPIFMQGISSATGLVIGSIVSAILLKVGLKK